MWQTVNYILAFIIAVLVLVTVHEFGHFCVARFFKIKVLRFSIGFGRPIWRRQAKSGTEYTIGILPLGGYVRLLDETEKEVAEAEKIFAFNRRPVWQRFLVVLAGPFTNFFFAVIAFWLIFTIGIKTIKPVIGAVEPNSIAAQAGMMDGQQIIAVDGHQTASWQDVVMRVTRRLGERGQINIATISPAGQQVHHYQLKLSQWQVDGFSPEPLKGLGITPYRPPVSSVISNVQADTPAAQAGIKKGDKIIALNGKPISDWYDFIAYIQRHPGEKQEITIARGHQQLNLAIIIGKRLVGLHWVGFLGVESEVGKWPEGMVVELQYNPLIAWLPAAEQVYKLTTFNYIILGKMLIGQISLKGLGGPITIFRSADQALKEGIVVYIGFLALISLMLGFVNLLPIPGLDGGHLLYYVIEIIRRRPLSIAAQTLTLRIGIILLLVLIVQATVNDIMRLL